MSVFSAISAGVRPTDSRTALIRSATSLILNSGLIELLIASLLLPVEYRPIYLKFIQTVYTVCAYISLIIAFPYIFVNKKLSAQKRLSAEESLFGMNTLQTSAHKAQLTALCGFVLEGYGVGSTGNSVIFPRMYSVSTRTSFSSTMPS